MREEDIILAEKYLENQLSDSEKIEVEKRMVSDETFAETVEFIRNVAKVFEIENLDQSEKRPIFSLNKDYSSSKDNNTEDLTKHFKVALNHVAKEYENEKKGKGGNVRKINFYQSLSIAASVLLILGIGVFFFLKNDVKTPQLAEIDELKKNESIYLVKDVVYFENQFGFPGDGPLSKRLSMKNLPIQIIKNNLYESHYFLSDTLYLLGNFSENIVLTIDSTKTVFIKDELKTYQFPFEKTKTITPLHETKSNLPKFEINEN